MALAQVQAQLLEALKGSSARQAEIAALKRDAERERMRLESEVSRSVLFGCDCYSVCGMCGTTRRMRRS